MSGGHGVMGAALCCVWALLAAHGAVGKKMNVLFLAADDLRPQLGAYSGPDFPDPVHPKMHTPNLDGLAGRSLLLRRAYAQQAVCSPSRTSLLTGRRPDTTHVYDLITYWRRVGGNYTTIPQYFKQHGYRTIGMGKIFHPGKAASGGDDPVSWTDKYYHADNSYWKQFGKVFINVDPDTEKQHPLQDEQTARRAVSTLRELGAASRRQGAAAGSGQPFFLAVGFHRPHLPWIVPRRFFDLYPLSEIRLPSNPYAPVNMPHIAWSDFDELRHYPEILTRYGYGDVNTTLPDNVTLAFRRGYYAAVSYTDYLVGTVLKELKAQGLENDTIISFWGDHGWQLGEHGEWCKHTNFELSTHAPFMVRVPGLTDAGVTSEGLAELVDLFPTLAEAAGLPAVPLCPESDPTKVDLCSEGVSLVPLMRNPETPWKSAAFSQYPRMAVDGNIYMGYTMRTDRYRYTEWTAFHPGPDFKPSFGRIFHQQGVELYDHQQDPQENHNRAFDAAYKEVRAHLSSRLRKGWRHALPPTH